MLTPRVSELPRRLAGSGDDTFIARPPSSVRSATTPRAPRGIDAFGPSPALVTLVNAARDGDDAAWRRLVARFDPPLRRIARSYRLSPADVDEVVQATWLTLFEAIEHIRDPAAIAGWLVTVTRRHALRRCQAPVREVLTDDADWGAAAGDDEPEARILAKERRDALAGAIGELPDRQARLLSLLLAQPSLDYREVAELLSMPVGSIGPTRGRALARLADHDSVRAIA
jgi:RNA polymerase sigma factor (sigma-70 family)